ncbi:unnamed protein product [Commensalibacter communis]|nr:unnamed protein product [Commensalibacter communis]CAI3960522.1 unnamed protein product [Commensalibacter communis]CAI3961564.1 unnamed protein product [Commensalibacter communis]
MAVYQQKIDAVFTVFTILQVEREYYIYMYIYYVIVIITLAREALIFKNSEDSEDRYPLYIYITL